ncbi:hypothetical protein V1525DRAFT_140572 [Lipomyces kononenkoae]|uniref:Uncharacterized protein n=1 Tax=Lipomyces kononenkoae TaxID=34357 RepID=A0ACC3TA89_LIPKO
MNGVRNLIIVLWLANLYDIVWARPIAASTIKYEWRTPMAHQNVESWLQARLPQMRHNAIDRDAIGIVMLTCFIRIAGYGRTAYINSKWFVANYRQIIPVRADDRLQGPRFGLVWSLAWSG